MAEPDAGAPDEPGKPRDLRFSEAEQRGVRVNRDLSGSGHLARGDRTHMSNLRFSVRAQPRTELDPELQALRPSPAPERDANVADPAPPPAVTSEAPAPGSDQDGGFFSAIKRLFS
jgi:hypothetical protein